MKHNLSINFEKIRFNNNIIFLIHEISKNKFVIETTSNFKFDGEIESLPLNEV